MPRIALHRFEYGEYLGVASFFARQGWSIGENGS
jgi:hypothetical protein